MIDAVTCIAVAHDARLVLLAAAMCAAGAFSVVTLFGRALSAEGVSRLAWHLLGAVALGAAVWCTHFIAILAYAPGVTLTFDAVLTIVSLLVPIVGAVPGLVIAGLAATGARPSPRWPLLPAVGGAIIGGAIAAMHFTGMAAFRVDGMVTWHAGGIVLSVCCAVAFSALAFALAARRRDGRPSVAAIVAFILAVLSLHFTGMAAMTITPIRFAEAEVSPETFLALALAIAAAGLIVITSGLFALLIESRSRNDAVARLRLMAMTDGLTGLANRAAFGEALAAEMREAGRGGKRLAVIAIDLDGFKDVNDSHGHEAGDTAMRAIAARFAAAVGADGCLARIGGDEFGAIVSFSRRGTLERVIARLEAATEAPVICGTVAVTLRASLGIACFPEHGTTPDQLASSADLALSRATAQPLTSHVVFDASMDIAARDRRALAASLREALTNGELALHYQLQASVHDGTITGYEALLRWRHPTRGMVPPGQFIPVAEEMGLIAPLGAWVLRRACADAAAWEHPWRVAVNISPLQLTDPGLPGLISHTLDATGLAPSRLEIELTETAIIADEERSLGVLHAIKALGVGVALDDFGVGYSSLKTLRSFRFDKIKLDRFFMAEIETSPEAKAMIRSVLALGRSLGIAVLAEGVERPSQLAILRQERCDEAQGFLLGRPGPYVAAADPALPQRAA